MGNIGPVFEGTRNAAIAALAACAALITLAPPAAEAGEYTVHTCRFPDGGKAGIGAWTADEGDPGLVTSWSTCPEGAYSMSMSADATHPANDHISMTLMAPPSTDIRSYSVWRNVSLAPDYNYRYYEIVDGHYMPHDTCFGDCTRKGGSFDAHVRPENVVHASGLNGVTGLQFLLTCGLDDSSTARCAAEWPAARFALHRSDITIRDSVNPTILGATGALVAEGTPPLSGGVPVSISATDQGGGVYQAIFIVDGKKRQAVTIDPNNGACAPPYSLVQPCRESVSGTLELNTRKIPDGNHNLKIRVTDATGTNSATWGPVPIQTSNGRCSPGARSKQMRLKARIAGQKRGRSARIRYGRRLRIAGRLTSADGNPVANTRVCVSSRPRMRRAGLRAEGRARTDRKGRFSFRLGPGPSRRVYFVRRLPDGAASDRVDIQVKAPIRVRPSKRSLRNGETVTFRGKLRAGPFPRRGVVVELQADRGPFWQTFGTTRTNRRGRFHLNYTFSRTSGVQNYKFRARVPGQATYPYAPGASRPVSVRVTG